MAGTAHPPSSSSSLLLPPPPPPPPPIPPSGYVHYDTTTTVKDVWYAGERQFVAEVVVVPRGSSSSSSSRVDDGVGWLVGLVHCAERGRTSLCIFDQEGIGRGPVARLWLKEHLPWGIHAEWASGVLVQEP